ncbi:MAG: hypothetical protein ICV83_01990 [Cytophagales bacterium]|nr:hypothetical protein [Cytophagales bacterium]
MKTTINLPARLLSALVAGLLSLAACDWDRPENTTQRENEPDSVAELDDRAHLPEAEIARERATFEKNMHETAQAFARRMQALEASVAKLPEGKQRQGEQMVAEMEKKLAAFKEQLAGMEKAEGKLWADYRNKLLGSSLDIKQHFARAEEWVSEAS